MLINGNWTEDWQPVQADQRVLGALKQKKTAIIYT